MIFTSLEIDDKKPAYYTNKLKQLGVRFTPKMYTAEELVEILDNHRRWLYGQEGKKERANLRNANLRNADLSCTDLSKADLSKADLAYADLNNIDLSNADLSFANLRYADLNNADLSNANLNNADLRCAKLSYAYLNAADLRYADLRYADLSFADLRYSDLSFADLSNADFRYADLSNADLSNAHLCGLNGNLCHVKSLQTEKYPITYTANVIQIGCQLHSIEEWKNFDDGTIRKMGAGALEWWTKWKPIIMKIIELAPCEGVRRCKNMNLKE